MNQKKSKLNILFTLFKISLSLAIIFLTIKKGMWDFQFITQYFNKPYTLIISFLLLCTSLVLLSYRWKNILGYFSQEAKTKPISIYLKIVWISSLFNSFLPGSVAGDLLRFKYKSQLGHNLKTSTTLLTTLLDRVIALMVVILIAGIAPWVLDLRVYTGSKLLGECLELVKLLSFIPLMFYILLSLPKDIFQSLVSNIPYINKKLKDTLFTIYKIRKIVLINTLITFIIQGSVLGLFLWWGFDLWNSIESAILLISMTALSFVFVAVPISPAGAGVGHMVFETLYKEVGLSQGANLFNLYFFVNLSINLLGIIPFVMTKVDSKSPLPKIVVDNSDSIN